MDINSITRNNDFRRIYSRGKSYVSPALVVYVMKNRSNNIRVGITTSKKIGNAVQRNRSRRIIREAYRELAPNIKSGYDLIFVARGRTPYMKSPQIKKHMERALLAESILERHSRSQSVEKSKDTNKK